MSEEMAETKQWKRAARRLKAARGRISRKSQRLRGEGEDEGSDAGELRKLAREEERAFKASAAAEHIYSLLD